MHQLLLAILVAPTNPVVKYFYKVFHKDPFRGIYQPNAFDLSILIPYFTILIILSIYGIHRYCLVYLYMKNRGKAPKPQGQFEALPRVTIQLPIYNERYVVERLLETVTRIEYPRDLLEIQVLDDSTDETRIVCSRLVSEYASAGHPITYHHRTNREGFKAGALAEGMKSATGEFIAIFDADFAPPPGILHEMIHYFTDPKVAVVQGRWTWINRHYSNLSEIEAILLDGHFVIEHGGRNFSGRFFNFNGTAGHVAPRGHRRCRRLAARYPDRRYGFELPRAAQGLEVRLRPRHRLPVGAAGGNEFLQDAAGALGQRADPGGEEDSSPRSGAASEPLKIKLEATFHLTANIAYPLMIVFSVILLPAMIVRFYQGWFQMLYLDLPLFLASTCSVSSFYMVAQRELYPRRVAQPHQVHSVSHGHRHRLGRHQRQGGD